MVELPKCAQHLSLQSVTTLSRLSTCRSVFSRGNHDQQECDSDVIMSYMEYQLQRYLNGIDNIDYFNKAATCSTYTINEDLGTKNLALCN